MPRTITDGVSAPMIGRAAALVALGGLAARTAAAAPPARPLVEALRVEPNECFDAASLAPEIARWREGDAVDRRIEVEISGQPAGAEGLTLRVRREGQIVGERRFPGLAAPCVEVRAAVALAAALAVDAIQLDAVGVRQEVRPASVPEVPPPRARPVFSTALDAVALLGVLPSPTGALAPGFGVRLAPVLDLRFSGLLSGVGSTVLEGGSLGVTLLAGRADACGVLGAGLFRARACLGLAAGRLQVAAAHVSPSIPWAAAMGRADVRVSLAPWLGFVLGGDAVVPVTRPSFDVVTPAGAPFATSGLPVVGAALSLGPEITFR
jgi:hypothetical protein